jgi:hypothetical protein
VRIWLKDSERRRDPVTVRTDDRKAFLVGIALWIAGLAAVIVFLAPLTESDQAWWLWTCVAGLAIGLIGVLYTHWRQKQHHKDDAE